MCGKSLGSLKSFLWYAPQLCRASILCFHTLSPFRVHHGEWLLSDGCCVCSIPQSCLALWDLMDCSPPSFSAYGNILAIIREWVAFSSSRGSYQPGIKQSSPTAPAMEVDSLLLSLWEALGSLMAARWQVFFPDFSQGSPTQHWLVMAAITDDSDILRLLMYVPHVSRRDHMWLANLESNPVSPYLRDHTDIHKKLTCNLHLAVCFIYVPCISVRIGP